MRVLFNYHELLDAIENGVSDLVENAIDILRTPTMSTRRMIRHYISFING